MFTSHGEGDRGTSTVRVSRGRVDKWARSVHHEPQITGPGNMTRYLPQDFACLRQSINRLSKHGVVLGKMESDEMIHRFGEER